MSTEQNIGENISLDRRKLLKTAGAIAAGMAFRSASPETISAQNVESVVLPPNEPFPLTELATPITVTPPNHFSFEKRVDMSDAMSKIILEDRNNTTTFNIFNEVPDPNKSLLNYVDEKIEEDLEEDLLSDIKYSTDQKLGDEEQYDSILILAEMEGVPGSLLEKYMYRGVFAHTPTHLLRMDAIYPHKDIISDDATSIMIAAGVGKMIRTIQFLSPSSK